jgi:hypothetical protein
MRRLALALLGKHRGRAKRWRGGAELLLIAARQPAAAAARAGDSHLNRWNRPPLRARCIFSRSGSRFGAENATLE